jgi:hypothetical protein
VPWTDRGDGALVGHGRADSVDDDGVTRLGSI